LDTVCQVRDKKYKKRGNGKVKFLALFKEKMQKLAY
jgi:hypothetical protein